MDGSGKFLSQYQIKADIEYRSAATGLPTLAIMTLEGHFGISPYMRWLTLLGFWFKLSGEFIVWLK